MILVNRITEGDKIETGDLVMDSVSKEFFIIAFSHIRACYILIDINNFHARVEYNTLNQAIEEYSLIVVAKSEDLELSYYRGNKFK